MKTLTGQTLITMTLTLALLAAAPASFAAGPSKRVDFTDLNLERPADVAILYDRIQAAARKVCEKQSTPWEMYQGKVVEECIKVTVDAAVKDVNYFALTALHKGQSKDVAGR